MASRSLSKYASLRRSAAAALNSRTFPTGCTNIVARTEENPPCSLGAFSNRLTEVAKRMQNQQWDSYQKHRNELEDIVAEGEQQKQTNAKNIFDSARSLKFAMDCALREVGNHKHTVEKNDRCWFGVRCLPSLELLENAVKEVQNACNEVDVACTPIQTSDTARAHKLRDANKSMQQAELSIKQTEAWTVMQLQRVSDDMPILQQIYDFELEKQFLEGEKQGERRSQPVINDLQEQLDTKKNECSRLENQLLKTETHAEASRHNDNMSYRMSLYIALSAGGAFIFGALVMYIVVARYISQPDCTTHVGGPSKIEAIDPALPGKIDDSVPATRNGHKLPCDMPQIEPGKAERLPIDSLDASGSVSAKSNGHEPPTDMPRETSGQKVWKTFAIWFNIPQGSW